MIKRCNVLCIFLCFYLFSFTTVNATPVADNVPEIHLVVDISGSMKHTDPDNLRINAIRMFNYLANKKARMSVAVFATNYKEIIPLQLVTPLYERLFLKKKNEIKSDGQWTNIDAALNGVNTSWGNGKRIIVLLTDGKVDLGSEQLDQQSRQNLNEVTLPKLQQDKVQVYTLGLSDMSDKELLKNIALKTNALSQTVSSASDLDEILYTIFTGTVNAEGAPLLKNKDSSRSIKVDPSIHEFTLVFQKNSVVKDLYLTNPEGKKLSIEKENNGILATTHYEMIKVKEPLPGEWILSGPEQQMERVIILTDIKLNTNFTTSMYFDKELLTLNGSIAAGGKTITSDMITENMNMNLELKNKNNKFSYVIPYAARGLFGNNIILNIPADTYKATWSANSNYLSRERQFMIVVHDLPFDLAINKEHDSLMIHLLKPDLIKEKSVDIKIIYKDALKKFPLKRDKLIWVYNLESLCQSSDFTESDVLIELCAETTSGRNVLFKLLLNGQLCGRTACDRGSCHSNTTTRSETPRRSNARRIN